MPAILNGFVSKQAQNSTLDAVIFENVLVASPCLCDVILSNSRLEEAVKPATDFASFTRSANVFFPTDYPLPFFSLLSLSGFGARLPRNNRARAAIT